MQAVAQPIPGSIDRTTVAAVLQSEYDDERCAIPVRLVGGPVEIQVPGLRLGGMFSVPLVVGPARRIVDRDPRRATIVIAITNGLGVAAIGRTQAEANDEDAFQIPNVTGPCAFRFTGEIWARAYDAPTRISVAVEAWTR